MTTARDKKILNIKETYKFTEQKMICKKKTSPEKKISKERKRSRAVNSSPVETIIIIKH